MSQKRRLVAPLPTDWPLSLLLWGYPVLWALGLSAFFPIFMAIPMALQLARRPTVRFPAGFSAWLFFLVVVAASALMLWVDAPTAVPGGGIGRLPVFGFRFLWYISCGVVLLWVCNLKEAELPTRKVVNLLGWMFLVTVLGGLLGVLLPKFEFQSPMELLLPGPLAKNGFIRPLIHPAAASIQNMAGAVEARPIAPFEFANSWGANFSMFLPFFCLAWFDPKAGWRRFVAPIVLVLGAIPVVSSLDRGLWGALIAGGGFLIVRLALRGQVLPLIASVVVAAVAVLAFLASPLSVSVANRLDNPHSNARRGQLLSQTVASMVEGSPVLGFGSTRDVQGSFASIAGGSTPDCKACAVPPLGTQGQLWLLLFAQGLLGTAFFFAFFLIRAGHHWRTETAIEAIGICLILFFIIEALVYDTLGMPLYTLMIGLALMWRTRADDPRRHTDGGELHALGRLIRRQMRTLAVCSLAGLMVGGFVAVQLNRSTTSVVSVLLAPAPVYIDDESDKEPKTITVDTEASMVFSEQAIRTVLRELDLDLSGAELRRMIRVTAIPNTKVLQIHVTGSDPRMVEAVARELGSSYLEVRREYLDLRRIQVLNHLNAQLAILATSPQAVNNRSSTTADKDGDGSASEAELRSEMETMVIGRSDPGTVLRQSPAKKDRAQFEVPVVSGLVLGMFAGAALASRREASRRRHEIDVSDFAGQAR